MSADPHVHEYRPVQQGAAEQCRCGDYRAMSADPVVEPAEKMAALRQDRSRWPERADLLAEALRLDNEPEIAECIELGMAWKACEAALPKGTEIRLASERESYWADAVYTKHHVSGSTPIEALNNLAALLRATEAVSNTGKDTQ